MPWLTDYLEDFAYPGTAAACVLGTGWALTGGKLVGTSSQANVDRWAYPDSAWAPLLTRRRYSFTLTTHNAPTTNRGGTIVFHGYGDTVGTNPAAKLVFLEGSPANVRLYYGAAGDATYVDLQTWAASTSYAVVVDLDAATDKINSVTINGTTYDNGGVGWGFQTAKSSLARMAFNSRSPVTGKTTTIDDLQVEFLGSADDAKMPRLVSTAYVHSTANPHQCGKPAGLAVGDRMVLFVMTAGAWAGDPAGWEELATTGATAQRVKAYQKTATADDVAAASVASLTNAGATRISSTVHRVVNAGAVTYAAGAFSSAAPGPRTAGFVADIPNTLVLVAQAADSAASPVKQYNAGTPIFRRVGLGTEWLVYQVNAYTERGGSGYVGASCSGSCGVGVVAIAPPADDPPLTVAFQQAEPGGQIGVTGTSWANLLAGVYATGPTAASPSSSLSPGAAYSGVRGVNEALVEYDLTGLPDGARITAATFRFKLSGLVGSGGTSPDTIELRAFDFGDTHEAADWRTPAQLLALPLCATWQIDGSQASETWFDFTSLAAILSHVHTDAPTRFILCCARFSGSAADLYRYATGYDSSHSAGNGPELVVTYTLGPEWSGESITINGGAASTDDNDVTLTLAAQADGAPPDEMAFSENGSSWSAWEAYSTSRAYQLSAQSSYPSELKTVWVKFRVEDAGEWYESDPISDTINLAVEWEPAVVIVNHDAEYSYSRTVQVRFRAYSSAHEWNPPPGQEFPHLVKRYRIRDAAGAWSDWRVASLDRWYGYSGGVHYHDWATTTLEFGAAGVCTAEVQWEDSDGNQWTDSDQIEVLGGGVLLANAPPPAELTNWRLQIGDHLDLIDQLQGPPSFSHGLHGPGSLSASLVVDDPMRKQWNELTPRQRVRLYDGTIQLWDGYLKPLAPTSSDESLLQLEAAGPLDTAKQHEALVSTIVDSNPGNWRVSQKASRAYNMDREGRIRIEHEKGRGVTGGKGAGIWYWANQGRRLQKVDHVLFTGYDIDVDASNWYARVQVAEHPWASWTTVKEWNNEAHQSASGTIRVPAGTDSFLEAGYDNVYAVKVMLVSGSTLTAAESANDRFVILEEPQVFFVDDEPRVDVALASWAEELGYATQTEPVGNPLSSLGYREEPMSIAAMMEATALRVNPEPEWYWFDELFTCRPMPSEPEHRARWYVIDTRRCDWGVVTNEENRKDYVAVTFRSKGGGVYPTGTVRTIYRPSDPPDLLARVAPLDLTDRDPMTEAQAQDAGDSWLRWNDAQCKAGPISGFGPYLRTVDGRWVAAAHARNGDWIQPLDLFGVGPIYITGVEVPSPDQVTLHTGGSERDWTWTRQIKPRQVRRHLGRNLPPGRRPRRPGWPR